MGVFTVLGKNQPQIPPDPPGFIPPEKPPIPGRAGDANDGGALWWDHDDPGQAGAVGEDGDPGVAGQPGLPGGDTPMGVVVTINKEIDGNYAVLIAGGAGQPAAKGGTGGKGGRGQDGGHSDDEQPAGAGGRGGRGGDGGPGGPGGKGGDIFEVDITIGAGIDASLVSITYTQGVGARGGDGGDPGAGGDPGIGGDGNPGMRGDAGTSPPPTPRARDGIVSQAMLIAG
jgi:hypothetical protein